MLCKAPPTTLCAVQMMLKLSHSPCKNTTDYLYSITLGSFFSNLSLSLTQMLLEETNLMKSFKILQKYVNFASDSLHKIRRYASTG